MIDEDKLARAVGPIFAEVNLLLRERAELIVKVQSLERRIEGMRHGLSVVIGKEVVIPKQPQISR